MSREILTKYRTKVIEDSIMIEGYMNIIISKYFLDKVSKKFFWEFLNDEYFNFGLRVNVLERILLKSDWVEKPKQIIEDLRRLNKIRNYFAHCNTAYFEGIEENAKGGIPHPKKSGEYLDFEAIYKEFESKIKIITDILIEVMDKIGVKFIYDTDKKIMSIAFDE